MFARAKKSGRYKYLQLVENRRNGEKIIQTVIATIGRLDILTQTGKIDDAVKSLSKFCKNIMVLAAKHNIKSNVFSLGPSLVFERLWCISGIQEVLRNLLKGRKFAFNVERAIYLTVLHRLMSPGSDRAANIWRRNYRIGGIENIELHHIYRAMSWLGEKLKNGSALLAPRCVKDLVEEDMFLSRRDLFTALDLAFFDTTSTYFEGAGGDTLGKYGHSKDHRPDRKQMIIGVVLDSNGQPICCEMWPGNTMDVKTLLPITKRLKKRFNIQNVCIVSDRGMISAETVKTLESETYGIKYIFGIRMRNEKAARQAIKNCHNDEFETIRGPRKKSKDHSPLKVKETIIDGRRCIICFNEEQARKDSKIRETILETLREKLKNDAKALVGNKGFRKYLKLNKGSFAIDEEKVKEDSKFDGYWTLRTNTNLSAADVASKYKMLWMVENAFKDMKSLFKTRPIYHKVDETIRGHVFCSFLALVLLAQLEHELEQAGYNFEWKEIKSDLEALRETEISHEGKTFIARSETQGVCGKVCQAVGVALPPTIRKK